jgi:hypothetical protein
MRRRHFRFRELASRVPQRVRMLVAGSLLLAVASAASAQPCCAGPALLTPGRLTAHEDALVGIQLKAGSIVGSFDSDGAFGPPSPGSSEYDLEQDVYGTLRVFSKGQVSVLVPFLESGRAVPGLSEFGADIGDLTISGRYDFLLAAQSRFPGIALLVGANVPTGRPPDAKSASLLGSNAAGTGAFQGSLGVALEQAGESLFADVTVLLTQSAPRSVNGQSGMLGLQLHASVAAGRFWDNGLALAATLATTASRDAVVNGAAVPRTGRSVTTVGIAGAWQFNDLWRLQASITDALPVKSLGENQTAGWGLALLVMRSWI